MKNRLSQINSFNKATNAEISFALVAMPEEVVGDTPRCAATSWLNVVCNARWHNVTHLEVGIEGNLSSAILEGTINNQGWVSNLIIKPQSQVQGGIVTGYIYRHYLK